MNTSHHDERYLTGTRDTYLTTAVKQGRAQIYIYKI